MQVLREYNIPDLYGTTGASLVQHFADVDNDGVLEVILNLGSADFVCLKPDGTEVWRRTADATADKGSYYPKITPDGTGLCFGHRSSNTVYCINLSDGSVRWTASQFNTRSMEICSAGLIIGGSSSVDIRDFNTGDSIGNGWPVSYNQHEQQLCSGWLGGEEVVALNDNNSKISIRRVSDATQVFELDSGHSHVDFAYFCDLFGTGENVYVTVVNDDSSGSGEGDEIRVYNASGAEVAGYDAANNSPAMAIGKFRDDYEGLQIVYSTENSTDISMLAIVDGNLQPIWTATLPAQYTTATALGQIVYGDFDGDGELEFVVNLGENNGTTYDAANDGFLVYDRFGNRRGFPVYELGWDFDPRLGMPTGHHESLKCIDWLGLGHDQIITRVVGADASTLGETVRLISLEGYDDSSFNELLGLGRYEGNEIAQGRLVYARFQETTGTTATDDSGNGFDGAISGMGSDPVSIAGPTDYLPRAFRFDGVNDKVTHTFTAPQVPRTYLVWVKTTSTTLSDVMSSSNGTSTLQNNRLVVNSDNIGHSPGKVAFAVRFQDGTKDRTLPSPDVNVHDGSWRFLTGTVDESSLELFIDGVSVASAKTIAGSTGVNMVKTTIGCLSRVSDALFYSGDIAGPLEFGRVLSPTENRQIKDGPEPANVTAPVLNSDGTVTSGTWDLPAPFTGLSNGEITRLTTLYRASDDSVVATSTDADPDFGSDVTQGQSYYVVERASNLGGFAPVEDTASDPVEVSVEDPDPVPIPETAATLALELDVYAVAVSPPAEVPDPAPIAETSVTLALELDVYAVAVSPPVEEPDPVYTNLDPADVRAGVTWIFDGVVYTGTNEATGGTVDTDALVAAILAGLESSHVQITRIGPEFDPATSTITLIAGDDYLVANDAALTFDLTLPGINLTGANAVFSAEKTYEPVLMGSAELIDTDTDQPKLRLSWTRAQTNVNPSDKYAWGVAIIDSAGLVKTIIRGPLILKPPGVNPAVVAAAIPLESSL